MTKIVNLFVFFLLALTAGTSSDAPLAAVIARKTHL